MQQGFLRYLKTKHWHWYEFAEPAFFVLTFYGGYSILRFAFFKTTITFNLTVWGLLLIFVWLPLLLMFLRFRVFR